MKILEDIGMTIEEFKNLQIGDIVYRHRLKNSSYPIVGYVNKRNVYSFNMKLIYEGGHMSEITCDPDVHRWIILYYKIIKARMK